jgi:hypothetical protein
LDFFCITAATLGSLVQSVHRAQLNERSTSMSKKLRSRITRGAIIVAVAAAWTATAAPVYFFS